MKILSFGEIIWDVFPDKKCIGGAPFNLAAHSAKQGADSYMLSALGDDSLAEDALVYAEKYSINTKYVIRSTDKPTGQCLVTLNEKMIPSYNLLNDTAYDCIKVSDTKALNDESFDAFCYGTLALRSENNRQTLRKVLSEVKFGEIYSDLNIRAPFYSKETVLMCLENATIVKISDEELPVVLELIYGENTADIGNDCKAAALKLCDTFKNIKIIIITLGSKGSYVYDSSAERSYSIGCPSVKVVSTVGAGDSFGAAFLANYLKGADINECLKIATEVSTYVVMHTEAVPD